TFRAKSMQQALRLVRSEIGDDANVLHTREIHGSLLGRLLFGRQIEVVASAAPPAPPIETPTTPVPAAHEECDYRLRYRADLGQELSDLLSDLRTMVASLCARDSLESSPELSQVLFDMFTTLIEADVDESTA